MKLYKVRHASAFTVILAALATAVTLLAQSTAPAAEVLPVHQVLAVLDGGQTVIGSSQVPAGIRVTGSASARPPGSPTAAGQPEPEHDMHAPLPDHVARMMADALINPGPGPSPVEATSISGIGGPLAAGDLIVKRDSVLTGVGSTATVAEPSVGASGNAMFQTYNWYAARSVDNGSNWTYINPYTVFPSTGSFSAGLCCDQRVTQDVSRNLIIWSLQYIENGTTNGIRIAVTHGASGLAANSWTYFDIVPGSFGGAYASGYWLDYPSLVVSSNYLYLTYNMFTTSDVYTTSVIGRAPLAALDAGTSFTLDTYVSSSGTITPVSGATSRMLFGTSLSATSFRVVDWPESTTTPTSTTVSGLNSTYFGTQVCTAFDGTNPCGRSDTRLKTGWLTASEVGFSWSSAQNSGAGRPYPFARVVILNPASLTSVLSQPDIWNANYGFQYPALAVNGRGDLGGVIDILGGSQGSSVASTYASLVRDSYSGGAFALGTIATSNRGTNSAWGDYNASVPHPLYPNTWLVAGKVQQGSTANSGARVHNSWIMRSADDPTAPTYTDDPLSAGVTAVKAVHITELRGHIQTLRTRYGLGAFSYTDSTLTAGTTTIKAVHITEMRSALSAAYVAATLSAPAYSPSSVTAGLTPLITLAISDLRSKVNAIW